MKTLAQFVHDYAGKRLDYDGAFGAQCVDLVRYYVYQCIGPSYELPPLPGAIDWFGKDAPAAGQQWLWVKNDVGNAAQYPKVGDIVVWHQDVHVGTGVYGHIDVFLNGDGYSFNGFDQNWPVGAACHVQHHSYAGVQGWGRAIINPAPKPPPTPVPPPAPPLPDPPVLGPSWDDIEDRGHRIHGG